MTSDFLNNNTRSKKRTGNDFQIPRRNGFLPKSPHLAKPLVNFDIVIMETFSNTTGLKILSPTFPFPVSYWKKYCI